MKLPNILNINFKLIKAIGAVFFFGVFNQVHAQEFNFNYAKSFGGLGQETQTDMSVDSAGNIVLLGRFSGMADFDPGPQENIKEAIGSSDIYLAKYNSLGDLIWVHTFGNNGTEMVGGCDFDAYGNIVFSGTFSLPLDVDPSENVYTLTNAGTLNPQGYGGAPAYQGFIVKLSSEGSFVWAYTAPAYYGSWFNKLRVNSDDEIVFFGTQYGLNWNDNLFLFLHYRANK